MIYLITKIYVKRIFQLFPENPSKQIFFGTRGTLYSRGHPGNYSEDLDDIYFITGTEGNLIRIRFLDFALEWDNSCGYDYVEVSNISSTLIFFNKSCEIEEAIVDMLGSEQK